MAPPMTQAQREQQKRQKLIQAEAVGEENTGLSLECAEETERDADCKGRGVL